MQMLVADATHGRYLGAHASSLTPAQNNAQLLYDAVKQRIISKQQLAIPEERSLTLGNYSGREIQFGNADQMLILRMYLINNQFYVLGVQALKAQMNPRAVKAFLNSFELLSSR